MKVGLSLKPDGSGRVTIDGKDYSEHVQAIEVDDEVGTLTTVTIRFGNVEVVPAETDAD